MNRYVVYEYCRNILEVLTTCIPHKIGSEFIIDCAYGGGEFHYIVIDTWGENENN